MQECEKIVRQMDFLKAIEVGDPPSAAEGLDLSAMGRWWRRSLSFLPSLVLGADVFGPAVVEPDYAGVKLDEDMTKEFIEDMIQRFRDGKKLPKKYVYQIVLKAKEIFMTEPTMPEVSVQQGQKMTVCGDTHGMAARPCFPFSPQPLTSGVQASISTSWKSSTGMASHPNPTSISSTAISSTGARGRQKSRCCSLPTSGCTPAASSSTAGTTRPTT